MKLSFSLLVFIAVVVSSCEEGLEPIPNLPPAKPFVTCYLTNSHSQIRLYYKTPVSAGQGGYLGDVKNALVEIGNGSQVRTMVFDTIFKVYELDTADMPLRKGMQYDLHIVDSNGTEQFASTVIPTFDPPVLSYTSSASGTDYHFDFSFTDSSNEEKYLLLQFVGLFCKGSGCIDTVPIELRTLRIHKKPDQHYFHESLSVSLTFFFAYGGRSLGQRIDAYAINEDMYYYFNSVEANAGYTFEYFTNRYLETTPSPVFSSFEKGNGIFGPVMMHK